VRAVAIAQGTVMTVNENVMDGKLAAKEVVDDTLSRLRLALGSSTCRGKTVGSSLRDGRLDAMMRGGSIVLIVARKSGAMILARCHPKRMRLDT